MLLPADPPEPNVTEKISKEEIQTGLLNKLVGSITDLKILVQEVRTETGQRLDKIETSIEILNQSDKTIGDRLLRSERRGDEFEDWRARSSERAKSQGQTETDLAAKIDSLRVAGEARDRKVDTVIEKTDAQNVVLTAQNAVLDKIVEASAARDLKVDTIDKKTDAQNLILSRLDKVASNPTVKLFIHAFVIGLVSYLASKGVHINLVTP